MSSIKDSLEAFQDASKYTQTLDVDAFERRGYVVQEIGFTCGLNQIANEINIGIDGFSKLCFLSLYT